MFPQIFSRTGFPLLLVLLLLSSAVSAQQKITGKVVSAEDQQPVSSASVLVKGTTKQTATNGSGTFEIDALPGDLLVISNVGFATIEIKAGEAATVSLKTDTKDLSEV